MRDPHNLPLVQLLHPQLRLEAQTLIAQAEESFLPANMAIRLTFTLRSIPEQNALYAEGRTAPGAIVTNARGGASFHNYGLAFDWCWAYWNTATGRFETSDKTAWQVGPLHHQVTGLFKAHGWLWGGDFHSIVDTPHLEKRFGYTSNCMGLYRKYLAKNLLPGSDVYVNL